MLPRQKEQEPMRRAFRVVTAFAGAVAGASAFAPAAGAAIAIPDRPATVVFNNCKAGESDYVHIYFPASKHHGPQCMGYNGSRTFPGTVIQSFCPGNNGGYAYFASGTSMHFYPGSYTTEWLPPYPKLTKIKITGHTGYASCSP
jgi:hypothetical protein